MNFTKRLACLYLTLILVINLTAQTSFDSPRQIRISKTSTPINLDGNLEEEGWKNAANSTGFFQRFPADTSLALSQTRIMLAYDDQFLYVGAICYDDLPGKYVVSSLRRDFFTRGNDYFSIILDPFNDQTNGFEFAVSPYGVQREALITNGGSGRSGTSTSWDNKWYVKTAKLEGQWVVEMAIPFKTLRYKESGVQWGINFARDDSKRNERSNWTQIPRNFYSTSLAYTGKLLWDKPLKKPGANIAVIPYLTGSVLKDYDEAEPRKLTGDFGTDIKLGITSSLNLDLTINPDFSQVEVDRQVTNLDRFEISFPERRQFFLENNDLFSGFGTSSLRPFFTRRIGIAKDIVTNETVQNKIIGGARLSGKVSEDFRIGLLNMQTAQDPEIGVPTTNYLVAVMQQKVFKRSNLSAIFINKHAFASDAVEDTLDLDAHFNRVVGLDYNHASADNRWQGKIFYHQSIGMEQAPNSFSHGASMDYNDNNWEFGWAHEIVGENYDAEVGFIRRTGYQRITPRAEFKLYPKSKLINRHGLEIEHDMLWSNDRGLTDRTTNFNYAVRFTTGDYVRVGYELDFVNLTSSFDPTRTEGPELQEGEEFTTHRATAFYFSDRRRPLFFFLRGTYGEYYNGTRAGISGDVNFRVQPHLVFSADISINRIELPDPYHDATLLLLGPKVDITFSKSLFFSTLVQYNNQIDNININARFQWRFAPVSDLFIVYTDNYYTENLKVKNRGIVLKLTYWLNV